MAISFRVPKNPFGKREESDPAEPLAVDVTVTELPKAYEQPAQQATIKYGDVEEDPDFAEIFNDETVVLPASNDVTPGSSDSPEPPSDVNDSGELVEWNEPLPELPAPEVLATGSVFDLPGGGAVRILDSIGTKAGVNLYDAECTLAPVVTESDSTDETAATSGTSIHLREAVGQAAQRLRHEAEARAAANTTQIARAIACFDFEDKCYYAEEIAPDTTSLTSLLETDAPLPDILHVLVQVAAATARLHTGGWAHLGLRPSVITLGKPVAITDFQFVTPLGHTLLAPISHGGYSAPELATQNNAVADLRADVYAIGAMLYEAVTGSPVPETGADLQTWQPRHIVAGVPQILRRCLGPIETRYNGIDELHRDLVRLKNRLKPVVSYTLAAASTIGLEPSRTTNQDAYVIQSGALQSETGVLPWALTCVADGMGGMAAGEVASELAVQSLAAGIAATSIALRATTPPTAADQVRLVKEWTAAANEKVCEAMNVRNVRGGCTFACALAIDRRLTIAHVGDCRIYLLRGDTWRALSRDHSFVMTLVLRNEIERADIRIHPDRNQVTRSLGERHPLPDYFIDSLEVETGAATLDLEPDDVILIGSDGLWEPVLETEMLEAVRADSSLQAAAHRLLDVALQRGAPDNATVALLRVNDSI